MVCRKAPSLPCRVRTRTDAEFRWRLANDHSQPRYVSYRCCLAA